MSAASDAPELAKKHLRRVQLAWDDPTDWADLSLYGFYCLECAVVAAALQLNLQKPSQHRAKVEVAKLLPKHGLKDVSRLLVQLNDARKAESYGDVVRPTLDPEALARSIEEFVLAVSNLVGP